MSADREVESERVCVTPTFNSTFKPCYVLVVNMPAVWCMFNNNNTNCHIMIRPGEKRECGLCNEKREEKKMNCLPLIAGSCSLKYHRLTNKRTNERALYDEYLIWRQDAKCERRNETKCKRIMRHGGNGHIGVHCVNCRSLGMAQWRNGECRNYTHKMRVDNFFLHTFFLSAIHFSGNVYNFSGHDIATQSPPGYAECTMEIGFHAKIDFFFLFHLFQFISWNGCLWVATQCFISISFLFVLLLL